MKMLALIAALAAMTACQNDRDRNLERKVDELNKKMDQLLAGGGRAGAAAPRPARPQADPSKTYAMPIEGDPFEGPADAKVTIVKAYDYACPYCDRVRGTMDDIKKKYGNDVRIVYKQFIVHPQARAGALAFCAAAKQGKAMQMDQVLWEKGFKNRQFDSNPQCYDTPEGCPVVLGFAQELGLDQNKFKADMKACDPFVQKDMRELTQLGVGATPGFFINGRFLSGAMPLENFVTIIDEELKKANERIQQGTPQAQYYQQWVLDKGLKTLEAPKQ